MNRCLRFLSNGLRTGKGLVVSFERIRELGFYVKRSPRPVRGESETRFQGSKLKEISECIPNSRQQPI